MVKRTIARKTRGSSATSLTRAGSPTGSASSGVSQPLAGRIQPSTPKAKLAVDILVVTPESNVGVINGKKLYSSRKKTVAGSAKKLLTTTTTPVSLPPGLSTTIIPPSPSIDPLLAPEYSHNPAGPASSSATNFKCPQCDKIYKGKHARSIWRRHLQDKHGIPLSSQPRRTRWDNDANRPKDSVERHKRTLESKRRWAKKHRAESGVGANGQSLAEGEEDDEGNDGFEGDEYGSDGEMIGAGGFEDDSFTEDAVVPPVALPKPPPRRRQSQPQASTSKLLPPPATARALTSVQRRQQKQPVSAPAPMYYDEATSAMMRASVSQGSHSVHSKEDEYSDSGNRNVHDGNSRAMLLARERERERDEAGLYAYYASHSQQQQQQHIHHQEQQHLLQQHRQQQQDLQLQHRHHQQQLLLPRPAYPQQQQQMRYSMPPPSTSDYFSDSSLPPLPPQTSSSSQHQSNHRASLYPSPQFPSHPQQHQVLPRSVSATHPPSSYLDPALRGMEVPSLSSAHHHNTIGRVPAALSANSTNGNGTTISSSSRPVAQSVSMSYSTSLPTFPTSSFYDPTPVNASGTAAVRYPESSISMLAGYDAVELPSPPLNGLVLPPPPVAVESKADAAAVLMALKTGSRSIGGGSSAPSSPGFYSAAPSALTSLAMTKKRAKPSGDEGGDASALKKGKKIKLGKAAATSPSVRVEDDGTITPRRMSMRGKNSAVKLANASREEDEGDEDDEDEEGMGRAERGDEDEYDDSAKRSAVGRRTKASGGRASPSKPKPKTPSTIRKKVNGKAPVVIDRRSNMIHSSDEDDEDEDDLEMEIGSQPISTPVPLSSTFRRPNNFFPSSAGSTNSQFHNRGAAQSNINSSGGRSSNGGFFNNLRSTRRGGIEDMNSLRDDDYYRSLHLSSAPLLPYSSRAGATHNRTLAGLITSSPPSAAYLFSSPAHPGISKQLGLTNEAGPGVRGGGGVDSELEDEGEREDESFDL